MYGDDDARQAQTNTDLDIRFFLVLLSIRLIHDNVLLRKYAD